MRVFVLSSTEWIYTLPIGFKEAGHEVQKSGTISENKLRSQIDKFRPDLIISMGWTEDQSIERQIITREVIKASGKPHVYWSVEDPAFTAEFSLPLIQRVQPDFVFSTCPHTAEDYKKMGVKAAYMNFGYNSLVHHPVTPKEQYKYSVVVVANVYPSPTVNNEKYKRYDSIKNLIVPLLKENIRVDFWGRDWENAGSLLGYDIPREWIHGFLPYLETNKVYSSSDIIIGLQNYPAQVTQRTYEILASGGFVLTDNTTRVRSLFKVGEHLAASSSPEETIKLTKYYLNHPEERRRISQQGTAAVKGDSYKERAKYMIEILSREGILKI